MSKPVSVVCFITATFIFLIANLSFKESKRPTRYPFYLPYYFPAMPVSKSRPLTAEGVQLGRYLFYDPILSRDSTISCSSCHRQEAAFSDAPNKFSKGRNGILQKRNTPPLFNLAWAPFLFWDGKASGIENQISHPLRQQDEMNMEWDIAVMRLERNNFYKNKFTEVYGNRPIDSDLIANAIGQFERTIISYRSKYDRVLQGTDVFTEDEKQGFDLVNDMTKGDCLQCHTTNSDPFGTTFKLSNNGLDTVLIAENYKDKGRGGVTGLISDYGKFKIPSLRNVAITAPYMHDGRFNTLEEVLDFYSEGVNNCANIDSKMELAYKHGAHLSSKEKRQIIVFLHTLTDSALISDKNFSNPFLEK